MRVLITGAAGCLGQALLPVLLADSRITEIIAHDQRALSSTHPRLRTITGDIRDQTLARAAAEVDAIVHMAFIVIESQLGRERHNRALAKAINLGGIDTILGALRPTTRLIHLSSASVYGASAEPLTESSPLQPLAGFAYAQDKAEVEERLMAAEARGLTCLRLRPHIILGPHAQPFLRGLLRLPFYPILPKPAPLLQLVHELDVVAAIHTGLFCGATGAVNLASLDSLSFEGIQRLRHRVPVGVNPILARACARLAFRHLGIGPDPAWSAGLDRALVLDCTRAREVLAWRPRFPRIHDILSHL